MIRSHWSSAAPQDCEPPSMATARCVGWIAVRSRWHCLSATKSKADLPTSIYAAMPIASSGFPCWALPAHPLQPRSTGRGAAGTRQLGRHRLSDRAYAGDGSDGMVLARATGKPRRDTANPGPHLRSGSGSGALWRGTPQRVLRQPVPRSHGAVPSQTRVHDCLAPESQRRGTTPLEPDRLPRERRLIRHRCPAVLWPRAAAAAEAPAGLTADLPSSRLQHEHSMAVLRDAVIRLEPGASTAAGFFGLYRCGSSRAHLAGGSAAARSGSRAARGHSGTADGAAASRRERTSRRLCSAMLSHCRCRI